MSYTYEAMGAEVPLAVIDKAEDWRKTQRIVLRKY